MTNLIVKDLPFLQEFHGFAHNFISMLVSDLPINYYCIAFHKKMPVCDPGEYFLGTYLFLQNGVDNIIFQLNSFSPSFHVFILIESKLRISILK